MNTITPWLPWMENNLVLGTTLMIGAPAAIGLSRVPGRWMPLYIPFVLAAICAPTLIQLQAHDIADFVRGMS